MNNINKDLLNKLIEEKLVSVQKHPNANLFIYNYTAQVQYGKLWNEITLQTRGLILDGNFNIVAKPFGKFFNLEEHDISEIPNLPFEVFDKLDGSLGILYWIKDTPYIATRGSFTSDQAKHATKLLHNLYSSLFDRLDKGKTYLFEIIYPENRIVVDYGETDDIILLTVIDNITGEESLPDIGFPMVKIYNGVKDFNKLRELEESNKEGFVIRFKNGFRIKMKFAEYVRLHRIITGVSNIAIWEYLKEGKSFSELLEKVPDEFYDWLTSTKEQLELKFNNIYNQSKLDYEQLYNIDKKTFALSVLEKSKERSSILFGMYGNKKIEPMIWKMIRPVYSKPFKTEIC